MRSINRRDFLQDSALLATTLAGAGIIRYWLAEASKPSEWLEELSGRVKNGETVTLLGETGPPVGARWQPCKTDALTWLDKGQVFRVSAEKQPGMLELLPSTPKRYRLRAELQHTDSPTLQGKVGIYCAHGKCLVEGETPHSFVLAAFNDRVPTLRPRDSITPPQSQIQLSLPLYDETKVGTFSHQLDGPCPIARTFIPAGKLEPMPWRKLEVEVTSERIKAFWEGELIQPTVWPFDKDEGVDPKDLRRLASLILPKTLSSGNTKNRLSERVTELSLGQGLGLYVEQGVAAFRSVVIEPLL